MKLLACEVPKKDYRPRGYDPKTQCDYHMGQMGHATKDCWRLKHKVQDLIDARSIQPDLLGVKGFKTSSWQMIEMNLDESRPIPCVENLLL